METKIIKVDGSFKGMADDELAKCLGNGWKILDKTIINERYINYVLGLPPIDPDVGKCSYGSTPTQL